MILDEQIKEDGRFGYESPIKRLAGKTLKRHSQTTLQSVGKTG